MKRACLILATVAAVTGAVADEVDPPNDNIRIGMGPSHIIGSPDPIFAEGASTAGKKPGKPSTSTSSTGSSWSRNIHRLHQDKVRPDLMLVQSWYEYPDTYLPETEEYTMTYTVLHAAERQESCMGTLKEPFLALRKS